MVKTTSLAADLELKVTSKLPKQGQLHIELYRVSEDLNKQLSWQDILSVANYSFAVTDDETPQLFMLNNLPVGPVCLRSFLDLNGNQILDRSSIGLPKEPVGFATNPPLMFGEPAPNEACFEFANNGQQLHIKLREKKPKKR